ncbi:MAG TPA: phosphoglycerate kinase [Vicinamibacterales bacterium]|nr:phosphoglycerate kinase [Vicinamibacterales bacterium]
MPRSVKEIPLDGQRVFIRVDVNVPIKNGAITDDTRIRASLPTIQYALDHGARAVILASHLGRPKGKPDPAFSLTPVAARLSELLGRPVTVDAGFSPPDGGVTLLENLRFHAEEEENDPVFAAKLAGLADVYINDAFGSAHRAHASTEGIVRHVKEAGVGLLMAAELAYLGRVLQSPDRPFVAILGGAKVSDKLEVIQNLLPRVDALLIGGAMAYTFFKSRGWPVGTSLVEDDLLDAAKGIERTARERGLRLEFPLDHIVAPKLEAGVATEILDVDDPKIGDRMGLDIGPKTIARYREILGTAKTVTWNGPMGVFEIEAFARGTVDIAKAVAAVHGTTVIGGGDSVAAVAKAGVTDRITHISTGGGASLEFLGGRKLPGVEALN